MHCVYLLSCGPIRIQLVLFGNMIYGVHIMQALPVKAALEQVSYSL